MVWNTKILISLLICLALQIHLSAAKPLFGRRPIRHWRNRFPGPYRNHNPWPWRHYGAWENEYNAPMTTTGIVPQVAESTIDDTVTPSLVAVATIPCGDAADHAPMVSITSTSTEIVTGNVPAPSDQAVAQSTGLLSSSTMVNPNNQGSDPPAATSSVAEVSSQAPIANSALEALPPPAFSAPTSLSVSADIPVDAANSAAPVSQGPTTSADEALPPPAFSAPTPTSSATNIDSSVVQDSSNPSTSSLPDPFASTLSTSAPLSSSGTPNLDPSPGVPAPGSPAPGSPAPGAGGTNIFVAIDTGMPPAQIAPRDNHPEQGVGLADGHAGPIQTNKFYTNWLLDDQTQSVFTMPYSLRFLRGTAPTSSWGMAVSQIDRSQTAFGPGSPASYFTHPIGLDSIIFSASELGAQTTLTTADHEGFSVTARLAASTSSPPIIELPVVQGMGMISAIYTSGSVALYSSLSFGDPVSGPVQVGSSFRFTVTLYDGKTWAIYMTPAPGAAIPTLTRDPSGTLLRGPTGWSGLVQVTKLISGETDLYDGQAGAYVTSGTVSGTLDGSYSIAWQKQGDATKTLVMFALPHHVESFAPDTKAQASSIILASLTKGTGTAIVADTWNLIEQLPATMGFAPWSPSAQSVTSLPAGSMDLIQASLATEIGQDFMAQTDLSTVYFSGKGLAKVASLVYLSSDLAKNDTLFATGLQKLEDAFAKWVSNQATSVLVYDTTWKGVVSSAGYADPGADYGATYYNDHMFHYGYFVYTAAVIATLDPAWLTQGTNKAYVNSLVRDFANSVTDDAYFPFSRCFDWYHGHSWASGLFAAGDGKNLESSSEDTFASFAIKMWGKATGDNAMEARGNLMLAVEARSLNNYFLMQSDNAVQPPQFIGNKATGILFDNKVDHTTYFGTLIEYIQGIHMIPIGAHSGLTRKSTFVSEEWATYFSNGRADTADPAWRGILYGNLALADPQSSWAFFSQSGFDATWLDSGASRSWYLAIAAALGGV